MILLLGASGYIGQAFARELQRRQRPFQPLSRKEVDYTRFDVLLRYLQQHKPEFLVNAAGYTGKPNVDACETAKADTLVGNALLPQTIAHACAAGVYNCRVHAGEIYQFHGNGGGCSAYQPGEGNNFPIALVQLTKRYLHIQREGQFQLVFSPIICWHGHPTLFWLR